MADRRKPAQIPLLERKDLPPADRTRIGRAVSALLAVGLASIAAIGILAIWHLVRRGRLIREQLGNPRVVKLREPDPSSPERLLPRLENAPDGPTLPAP
jgi:hypothetical protein